MKQLIKSKNQFYLYKPIHCYDTNYHLIDYEIGQDHLIDIDDVGDTLDFEEYQYLLTWDDLKNLVDTDELIAAAWTTKKIDYEVFYREA